jgi:hypothetical protein
MIFLFLSIFFLLRRHDFIFHTVSGALRVGPGGDLRHGTAQETHLKAPTSCSRAWVFDVWLWSVLACIRRHVLDLIPTQRPVGLWVRGSVFVCYLGLKMMPANGMTRCRVRGIVLHLHLGA